MTKYCPTCQRRQDPSWQACPYCAREAQMGAQGAGRESTGKEGSMSESRRREPTRVGSAKAGERETRSYPERPDRPLGAPQRQGDNRRIVGVLVSYTWDPGGQLFGVREGRTHIGSGEITEEAGHVPVEVQCPRDSMLSGDHALILVQQGQFYLRDLSSTNGTFLNGKALRPEVVEDLPSPAEIRAGNTVFTFVRLDVGLTTAEPPRPSEEPGSPKRPPTVLK